MPRKKPKQAIVKPAIAVATPPRSRRYRLLVRLPRAVSLASPGAFRLGSDPYPEFAIGPIHEATADQINIGGSYVAIEFLVQAETDLIRILARGTESLAEALAAVALVSGVPLGEFTPVQLLETTPGKTRRRFIFFLSAAANSWPTPISQQHLQDARTVLAHWDGIENGHRLRRAAYLYADAIAGTDVLDVFERGWLGLEALEPPLAKEANRDSGSETITTSCSKCGAEYTYKKTVLGGVRAYVSGELHDPGAVDRRDWKRMNDLRADLTHSLDDLPHLRARAQEEMPGGAALLARCKRPPGACSPFGERSVRSEAAD